MLTILTTNNSAGFGLVGHQFERPDNHVAIDLVKDFRELTEIKMRSDISGLFMIGGGVYHKRNWQNRTPRKWSEIFK